MYTLYAIEYADQVVLDSRRFCVFLPSHVHFGYVEEVGQRYLLMAYSHVWYMIFVCKWESTPSCLEKEVDLIFFFFYGLKPCCLWR